MTRKQWICLVLVFVLMLGLLPRTAAASLETMFQDYADITPRYREAVACMRALYVLNGYEDETFKPTNPITRAEMAKTIAVLANAGDDSIDKLYAPATQFSDVPSDYWYASYVNYCDYTQMLPFISGDVFSPNQLSTGLELASMLLVLLGYDPCDRGYCSATTWTINVLRDAKHAGLMDSFEPNFYIDQPITRQEAAQLMWNALQAKINATPKNLNSTNWIDQYYQDSYEFYLLDSGYELYGNQLLSSQSLYTQLFPKRVTLEYTRDKQGRPGHNCMILDYRGKYWNLNEFFAETPDYIYFGEAATLLDDLNRWIDVYFHVYIDGKLDKMTPKEVNDITANYAQTEVYLSPDTGVCTIVLISSAD